MHNVLSPFPWKKTPKFWSFFVLGSLLFRGGKIPISSHAKPPRPEEVSEATVSSLGLRSGESIIVQHVEPAGAQGLVLRRTPAGGCACGPKTHGENLSPLTGVVSFQMAFSWLINGGYQLLTNWNDPPDSRWCMGWDMVNVGHSTTTKKICVFFSYFFAVGWIWGRKIRKESGTVLNF